MHAKPLQDRRSLPRYRAPDLCAELRVKGRFARTAVEVLDFNRHGLAIRCLRPLPKDQIVFISLADGEHCIDRVIGIVHNCMDQEGSFRCGIRFRTQSILQFDRELVDRQLYALERSLAEGPDGTR